MRRTSLLAALALAASLALAGCGSGSDDDSVTTDSGVTVAGAVGEKPDLTIPDSKPSDALESEVLTEGDGPKVGADDFVVAHYLGQTWEPKAAGAEATGSTASAPADEKGEDEFVFDNSYDKGQAVGFSLNGVIPGWKEGLADKTVGSRVLLSIPPGKGYGEADDPEAQGNELAGQTLVFVVDIVDAVPADAGVSGEPVADLAADLPTVAGEGADEPVITFNDTSAVPTASDATLLVAGDGEELGTLSTGADPDAAATEAPAVTNLVVQVVQASYATKQVQYSTRTGLEGQPAEGAFSMTADQLPGLAAALEGQKVGSRVLVRVAAADNVSEAAPEGEALVIVVDVVGVYGDPEEEK